MLNEKAIKYTKKTYGSMVIYKEFDQKIVIPTNNGNTGVRGTSETAKSTYESMKRTKENIRDLVINNDFTHWGTVTYDSKKINRYDLEEIQKKTSQYLKNIKKRYDNNMQYLLIFEQHKDKAWHGHMFLKTLAVHMENATTKKGNDMTENGQSVLNWKLWANKFGFTKFLDISHLYGNSSENYTELLKVSNYITKYITKDLIELRANKKKYWASRGLTKPKKESFSKVKGTPGRVPFHKSNYSIIHHLTGEVVNAITTTCYEELPF